MTVSSDIAVLRKFPLFRSFSREHLRLLAFSSEQLFLKKGDVLFYEKEPADCAFVIVSGQIELSYFLQDNDTIINLAGPDELIGETALIAPNLIRKSTARVKERSHILKLSQIAFRRFLTEFPALVPSIYSYFNGRVNRINTTISQLP